MSSSCGDSVKTFLCFARSVQYVSVCGLFFITFNLSDMRSRIDWLKLFHCQDGLFAPCYTSLWHRFAMIIAPKNPRSASIINFFLASRGIVNIMTGPLCGLLLNTPFPSTRDYRGIINACGTLLLISSLGVTMRVFYRNSPEGSSEEEPIEMC